MDKEKVTQKITSLSKNGKDFVQAGIEATRVLPLPEPGSLSYLIAARPPGAREQAVSRK